MKKWKKIKTTETHDYDGYYRVEKDEVITPGGKPGQFSVVRKLPFSVIIPIDADGNVYMVRQHRYNLDRISLELPSGCTDGQNSLFAAKRELEEETSLVSSDWKELGWFDEGIGMLDMKGYVFIAHDVKKIDNPRKDPLDKDVFKIEKYSVNQIKKMIAKNAIADGATISAFSIAFFQGELDDYEKK
ncbi:MAG: NUDIX hydrolase [Candidatus Moranbacteria bacterium]|nr:NUDIX hydrolase [Candidatus Moranbacteria bacterium]